MKQETSKDNPETLQNLPPEKIAERIKNLKTKWWMGSGKLSNQVIKKPIQRQPI